MDDGGSEKGKQEDPGSDPRMPSKLFYCYFIPAFLILKNRWPQLEFSFIWVHFPQLEDRYTSVNPKGNGLLVIMV